MIIAYMCFDTSSIDGILRLIIERDYGKLTFIMNK